MITSLDKVNRVQKVYLKQIYSDPLIKMKKYKDSFTILGPGLDKNGKPVTGLTEDRVEFKGNKQVTVPGTRPIMEKMLDMVEGSLKHTSVYWVTFNLRIGAEPIELDLQDPLDLLKYLFAMAQSIVADGIKAIGTKSSYEFVMYSTEQEAASRVNSRKNLSKAYILADKLDMETKMNILAAYGIITDATSPNAIEDKIGEKIDEDPAKFLRIADDKELEAKSLVTKLLDKGVLTMKGGSVMHGEVSVGYDKDTAAKAISKDATLQAILKAKLSGDLELVAEIIKKK